MRTSLTSLAFCVVASAACAADMPFYKAFPSSAPAPVYWSGFYLGGHVGSGAASFDGVFDSSELPGFPEQASWFSDLDVRGFAGGLHAGYNWRMGMLVVGVEADATFMRWRDRVSDAAGGGLDSIEAQVDVLASFRGRFGVAIDRLHLYATAGLALADAGYTLIDDDSVAAVSGRFDRLGFVAGAGTEVLLTEAWSVRLEGLYYRFDDHHDTSALTVDSDVGDFARFDNAWLLRAGASFHF